jgi:hypothetical protein
MPTPQSMHASADQKQTAKKSYTYKYSIFCCSSIFQLITRLSNYEKTIYYYIYLHVNGPVYPSPWNCKPDALGPDV